MTPEIKSWSRTLFITNSFHPELKAVSLLSWGFLLVVWNISFYSDVLTSGLLTLGKLCFSRNWLVNNSYVILPFIWKLSNSKPIPHPLLPPPHLLYLTLTLQANIPLLLWPHVQIPDNSRQSLHLRACWNYSDQPILTFFTLPHLFFPM